jgi:hypothetical protein
MSKSIAKVISTVFHPLLVPTYALLMIMNLQTHSILSIPVNFRYIVVGFVFLSTFVLPSIIIFLLLKAGRIKSLEMENRRERVFPILIIALSFYGTYYLLKQTSLAGLITLFMVGSTMLVLIALLINYATKISLHMIAWGGVIGTLFGFAVRFHYNLTYVLFLLIVLTGVIATARLRLNAHSPFQVYLGFLIGAIGMASLFFMV